MKRKLFKYYTLAADNGNTMSMYRTGLLLLQRSRCETEHAEAYRWFRTDAAGNENIAATYYLGKMMMYGEGCTLIRSCGAMAAESC